MSLLDSIRYRLRVFTRSREHEADLAEDMEFFMSSEARMTEHAAKGAVSAPEAKRSARRRFGNATYYGEEARAIAGLQLFDVLAQDARFALRTFARTPVFTAVAVATLAIGIGANTAIFSAVDTLLLRPLPFRDPERLMSVALTVPATANGPANDDIIWSLPKLQVLRASQHGFASLTAWFPTQYTIRAGDEAQRVTGEFIDAEYFPTLGVVPALGRAMRKSEDYEGGPPVAVISDELWKVMFNADPAVLGKPLNVDGVVFTIVGVAPEGFNGVSGNVKFWIPPMSGPPAWDVSAFRDPRNHSFFVMGRLAPGVTPEQAAAMVRDIGLRIDAQYPENGPVARRWGATAHRLDATRVPPGLRRSMLLLLSAVGMVLLVACANVASLFLVRAASRRREIAVRLAIGASRARLVRQLIVESVVLALVGAVASLFVAWVGVRAISAAQPTVLAGNISNSGIGTVAVDAIRLDLVALAFTAGIAIVTGVLFGLVPAIQTTRPSLTESLKADPSASQRAAILRRVSTRDVLTTLEIALAVVLLAGSGVLIRSLLHIAAVRPGFEAAGVLTMRVNRAPAWSRDSITRFYDVAIDRLSEVPGVTNVAIADCSPQSGGCSGGEIQLLDHEAPKVRARTHWITPQWADVMKVPLMRGRMLESSDRRGAPFVVVVNETAARNYWPGENPIGKRLVPLNADTAVVVGVVGDVRYGSLQAPPVEGIYMSYYQQPLSFRMMLHLRTASGDPAAITESVRRALREVAPGFPMYDVATLDARISGSLAEARFMTQLLTVFAVLAIVLATIGTYGVISYAVAQRTREMGIRIALGATSADVIRLVVGQGAALAAVGGLLGLIGAAPATRLMRAQLYGVEPSDPVTLGGIVIVLTIAALVACWVPARRAANVPAVQALRGQ
ncbi:MAG TPA: ABC transporter permease [Gemmatimonadaceae bacterium]|nr:ABC transporter permease [Gemmatimonadaceae bacterium]